MNHAPTLAENDDPELLARCLRGERDAFNGLVTRYQGLLCAQAYSICGDFSRSEDVAQEAFVAAWRQLPTLRDPSRFRAWLCGIARHLALAVAARRKREQPQNRATAEATTPETPHDTLVSREEEALVWHTLEKLPAAYREVLVLFYREQQSVFQVAALLGLSEEAVKQRLSRGRAMLKQEVAGAVEITLARTRPGPSFTLGVLGAVAMTTPATTGPSVAATLAKGGPAAKLLLASASGLGALAGMLMGFLGGWIGVKVSAESLFYERQRAAALRFGRRMFLAITIFMVIEVLAISGAAALWHNSGAVVLTMACLCSGYGWWIWREIRNGNAEMRRIREEDELAGVPRRTPGAFWAKFGFVHEFEIRSRHTFLGWPLWHLQWGQDTGKKVRSSPRAWLAVGDKPIGFIAMGAVARGVFAFGGVAIGGLCFGGASVGMVSLCGCGLAIWGYGGVVIGWVVQGGFAIAWHVAMGAIVLARDYGLGHFVVAAHANDPAAQAAAEASSWLHLTLQPWFPLIGPMTGVAFFLTGGPVMSFLARRRKVSAG